MNKASYWAQEVQEMLDIAPSTLRRWAGELEKKGYQFEKVEKKRRYYERDVIAIRSIKEMNERQGMTIDEAINTVISKHNMSYMTDPNMLIERQNDSAELALSTHKEVKILQEIYAKGYMDLKQENSDLKEKISALKEELREELRRGLQEVKVTIVASQEPKEKKGWLSKLLGK